MTNSYDTIIEYQYVAYHPKNGKPFKLYKNKPDFENGLEYYQSSISYFDIQKTIPINGYIRLSSGRKMTIEHHTQLRNYLLDNYPEIFY